MTEIDKEISEMKLALNARARISATEFLKNVSTDNYASYTQKIMSFKHNYIYDSITTTSKKSC